MRLAAIIWLMAAGTAFAQAASPAAVQDDARRLRSPGGGIETPAVRPDLSVDFDPFAPDNTPPPRQTPFDPRRPSLHADDDPLAALIRNGPKGAVLAPSQSPEPWMLPGTRRTPTLGDPPPGSAPAARPVRPTAPEG